MSVKRIMGLIIVAVLSVLTLSACGEQREKAENIPSLAVPMGMRSDTVFVTRGNIEKFVQYSGIVRTPSVGLSFSEVQLPFAGFNVLIGQEVKEGDVLASLDTRSVEERISETLESIEEAERNNRISNERYERDIAIAQIELHEILQNLSKEPLNTQLMQEAELKRLEINRRQTELNQARERQELELLYEWEEIEAMRAEMRVTELIAPFDGVITYVMNLANGASVDAYQTLIYISRRDELFVEYAAIGTLNIPRNSLINAEINGKIYELTRMALSSEESLTFTRNSQTIPVRFSFVEPDSDLSAGQYATIRIYSEIAENVLRIPINALSTDESGENYVYVNVNGNKYRLPVEKGVSNDVWVEIRSILPETDELYLPLEEGTEIFVP